MKTNRQRSKGATAIEMALVMIFIVQMMLGIVDFSRWLLAMITANEATRYGARIAAVCSLNASGIANRMLPLLPSGFTASNVSVVYGQSVCATGEICQVSVSLVGSPAIQSIAWFLPSTLPIPSFATVLPRESLSTTIGTGVSPPSNPLCS